jgi:murein hydrolase activator
VTALGLMAALAVLAPTERSILDDLEHLDRALVAAERQLAEVEGERVDVQKEIARLEADQAVVTTQRGRAYERFTRRIRALAYMPAGARLVLLGGSRSLAEYLEMTRLLRWIAHHDRRLHEHYVEAASRLRAVTSSLDERRRQLAALEDVQRQRRDELAGRRQARLDLLTSVMRDKTLADRTMSDYSAAGRELANTVRKLTPAGRQSKDFAKNRGRLPWPAVGPVDARFGQQMQRASGTTVTQNGLDIRARIGARVQAVADGKVVFADWLRGYGQLVIVDHGDGYHTLAAHLGALLVKVGDEVSTGEPLGAVGDTGSLTGTVLYFELRQRGVPIDPLPWLRR